MKPANVAAMTVIGGAALYAFKRLEPITESTTLFPFFTFFIVGLALNSIVLLFWLQLYEDMREKLWSRILWYSVMVSWPLATDQMAELFVRLAITGAQNFN